MVLIVTALNASGGCATALSSLTPNNNHQDETGITYKLGSRLGSKLGIKCPKTTSKRLQSMRLEPLQLSDGTQYSNTRHSN